MPRNEEHGLLNRGEVINLREPSPKGSLKCGSSSDGGSDRNVKWYEQLLFR